MRENGEGRRPARGGVGVKPRWRHRWRDGNTAGMPDAPHEQTPDEHAGRALRRLQLIAENATDMITCHDGAALVYASDSCRDVLGYEPETLVGKPAMQLIHPDDRAHLGAAVEQCRDGRQPRVQYRALHASGMYVWLESSFKRLSLFGACGLPEIMVSSRDVSEARALRLAVEESESRFRSLVQHSADIITLLAIDGSWRYSSPAGFRLLGYESGFDPPGGLLSLVHADDAGSAAVALSDVIDNRRGPNEPVVFRVRHAQGHYRWFETNGQNLADEPAVRGIVLNSRDITERLEAQDLVRQRDVELEIATMLADRKQLELQLERALRFESLGRLAGGVAHDFNNLLGVINNYVTAMVRKIDDDSPLHDDAEHIRAATTRAALLTNDLLIYIHGCHSFRRSRRNAISL